MHIFWTVNQKLQIVHSLIQSDMGLQLNLNTSLIYPKADVMQTL